MLRSDGSDFRLLPQQTTNDGAPAWAPDGMRFVFTGLAEGADEPTSTSTASPATARAG